MSITVLIPHLLLVTIFYINGWEEPNDYYTSINSSEWPWSNEQKRKYVWGNLTEAAQKAGSNTASYFAYLVKDEGDYEPIFLDRSEQFTILQDFDVEGKIRLIGKNPDQKYTYDFELLEPKRTDRSPYSRRISSIADLIKDIELRNRVMKIITLSFGVFDAREIKATQAVKCDVHESEDGLLLLMDEMGLTETDWDSLKHQTHRVIGNRYVNVFFKGDMAKKLADAMFGRSSIIRTKAVDQIASLIKDLMSQDKLNDFFIQVGVPTSLILDNQHSKHDLVYNVILALSSTGEQEDRDLLDRIFEELAHPLTFQGNTKNALDFQHKITKVIRYDGLSLLGGKVHTFGEADETKMDELERKENGVDQTLGESISSYAGGNFFDGFMPHPAPMNNPPTQQQTEPKKTEPQAMHVHIYNDNKNTQSIQVPIPYPHSGSAAKDEMEVTSLKDVDVLFDDAVAKIRIGKQFIQLPPHRNEHLFCRAVFEYKQEEPIDWSVIYEKMSGTDLGNKTNAKDVEKQKRTVYDTMKAINDRVCEGIRTEDKLFVWDEKTVKRAF